MSDKWPAFASARLFSARVRVCVFMALIRAGPFRRFLVRSDLECFSTVGIGEWVDLPIRHLRRERVDIILFHRGRGRRFSLGLLSLLLACLLPASPEGDPPTHRHGGPAYPQPTASPRPPKIEQKAHTENTPPTTSPPLRQPTSRPPHQTKARSTPEGPRTRPQDRICTRSLPI